MRDRKFRNKHFSKVCHEMESHRKLTAHIWLTASKATLAWHCFVFFKQARPFWTWNVTVSGHFESNKVDLCKFLWADIFISLAGWVTCLVDAIATSRGEINWIFFFGAIHSCLDLPKKKKCSVTKLLIQFTCAANHVSPFEMEWNTISKTTTVFQMTVF